MIVFDLRCATGHVFEAWFANGAAYDEQRAGGQVSCPLCGDGQIDKAAMAPAVPAKSNAGPPPAAVQALPEPLKTGVIDAFTHALAPSFWYLVPVIAVGFVLALFLREVKLSDVAGMVARGEALAADGSGIASETVDGAIVVDDLSPGEVPMQRDGAVDQVDASARR